MSTTNTKQSLPAFIEPVEIAAKRLEEGCTEDDLLPDVVAWASLRFKGLPWQYVRPRFGLECPAYKENKWTLRKDVGAVQQWVEHKCAITKRTFELPLGAPAPCILLEPYDADGEHQNDGEPYEYTIHPELMVEGEAAIREALKEFIQGQFEHAADAIHQAMQMQVLLGEMEDLREPWPIERPAYWQQPKTKKLHNVRGV